MLIVVCPNCGPRPEHELVWGGEDGIVRPPPAETDDARWTDYLFFRRNLKGLQIEHWCCAGGCGEWFKVARDATTHQIRATWRFSDSSPLPRETPE